MKRITAITLVLCLLLSGMALFSFSGNDNGLTTEEHNDDLSTKTILNVPASYPTIQAAISAASASGDTVQVSSGLYPENIVIPSGKSVDVIGAGSDTTIIWGGYSGTTVTINGDGCTIKGFKINASGMQPGDAGILLNSDNNVIEECNISRNNLGICLNNSDFNTIQNNSVSGNFGVNPPTKDGLVGHWKMDEDSWDGTSGEVKDSSGNGNDGTANGGVTTVVGKFGRAGDFDGSNDYVDCGNDASLKPQHLTVSTWIKPNSLASTKNRVIVDGDASDSVRGFLLLQNSTNELRLDLEHSGGPVVYLNGTTKITVNKYYLFTCTFDGSKARVYVNGNCEIEKPFASTISYGSNPIYIGRYNADPGIGYDFDGQIDDVRIYDHALSEEEIRTHYLTGITGGLRLWHSHNNTISNNSLSSNAGDGIQSYSSHVNDFNNNTLDSNYRSGTLLDNCIRNNIADNIFEANYGCNPVTDGLVGCWKMDEPSWSGTTGEVKDSSGNGNDGTAKNGATVSTNGRYMNAGDFDGINDHISIPDSSSLDIIGELTIQAWVKYSSVGSPLTHVIKGETFGNPAEYCYGLNYLGTTSRLYFQTNNDVNTNSLYVSWVPQLNTWYHLAGTHIDDDIMKLYINGMLVGTFVPTYDILPDNYDLHIGASNKQAGNPPDYSHDGLIDEVRIYNRSLSEEEVIQNYLSGIRSGITLRGSDDNNLINNTLDSNIGHGISLNVSDDNILTDNTLIYNNGTGICLQESDGNDITGNTVESNDGVDTRSEVGLVGHWKMDEASWSGTTGEVKDSSGNGNDGTAKNGATVSTNGRYMNAGDFDGSNDYIDCGGDSIFDLEQGVTLEAWIYKEPGGGYIGQGQDGILCTDKVSTYSGFNLQLESLVDSKYKIEIGFGDGTGSSSSSRRSKIGPAVIEQYNWYHVTGLINGPTNMIIYVNGVDIGGTYSGSGGDVVWQSGSCTIGTGWTNLDYNFKGLIDDVRIYNRALTEKEVHSHYLDGILGGIHLRESNSNTITDNFILNSTDYSHRLTINSDSNTIDHNYIINNNPGFPQASDDGTSNSWDTGIEGNYWSDWQSPDSNFPYGIVDLPYDLEGLSSSKDNYPICLGIGTPTNLTPFEDDYYEVQFTTVNGFGTGSFSITTDAGWLSTYGNGTVLGTPTNNDVGLFWVNATISDKFSTVFKNITIDVQNVNDAPTIDTSDITTAYEDSLFSVIYTATDIDPTGDMLTWNMTSNTTFLSMNTVTGNLSGTPTNDDIGIYWVNVTVSDGLGGYAWSQFDLTILNTNDDPWWVNVPGDAEIYTLEEFVFDANASDMDVEDVLTYSIISNPTSSISINAVSGSIYWKPTEPGDFSHNLSVTDGDVTLYHDFSIKVIEVVKENTPPNSTLISPLNKTKIDVLNPVFTWTVADVEEDPVFVDLYIGTVLTDVQNLVSSTRVGIGLEDTTFASPTSLNRNITYYWTVIPNDRNDTGVCLSGVWSFTIKDTATVNHPPKFTSDPTLTAMVDNEWSYEPVATDSDNDTVTISLESGPDGITFLLGTLRWTPDADQLGGNDITLKATDGQIEVLQEFTVNVEEESPRVNEPPSINPIANKAITEGDSFEYQVAASDPEGEDISYEIMSSPDGMSISDSGLITWEPKKGDAGTYQIRVRASDGENAAYTDFSLTVEEKEDKTTSGGWGLLIILIIAAIVVILLVIIAIVILMRRKQKKEPEEDDEGEDGKDFERGTDDVFVKKRMLDIEKAEAGKEPPIKEKGEEQALLPPGKEESEEESSEPPIDEEPDTDIIDEMPPTEEPMVEEEDLVSEEMPPGMEEPITEEVPPDMEQFMADGTEQEPGVYHEDSSGVWSPDMVQARTAAESKTAMENLKDLADLKEKGIITEEEFKASKKRLLRKI